MIQRSIWLLVLGALVAILTACGGDTTYKCGTNTDGSPILCSIGAAESTATTTTHTDQTRSQSTTTTTSPTPTTTTTVPRETVIVVVPQPTKTITTIITPEHPPIPAPIPELTLSLQGDKCGGTQVKPGMIIPLPGMIIELSGGGPNMYRLHFSAPPPFRIVRMIVQTTDVEQDFAGYRTVEDFSNSENTGNIGVGPGQSLDFFIDTGKFIKALYLCSS